MIIIERHWHAVIGEHQKRQRASFDFLFGDKMTDECLEKRFIRNPGRFEEPHDVLTLAGELQYPFDRATPQTPPLRSDLYLQIFGNLAGDPELLLDVE